MVRRLVLLTAAWLGRQKVGAAGVADTTAARWQSAPSLTTANVQSAPAERPPKAGTPLFRGQKKFWGELALIGLVIGAVFVLLDVGIHGLTASAWLRDQAAEPRSAAMLRYKVQILKNHKGLRVALL